MCIQKIKIWGNNKGFLELKGDFMASIKKVNNKKGVCYRITVTKGYDITGKKLAKTTTYYPDTSLSPKQQEIALQAFAIDFENKVRNDKILDGSKMTFYEFTVKWIKEYASYQLEKTTLASYVDCLDRHIIPYLGHYKLTEIKPLHLQSFYNSLLSGNIRADGKQGGYSSSTIKKYHAVISSILSTAYYWEIIDSNPCDRVKPPKLSYEATKIKYFTIEQANRFLKALDLKYVFNYSEHSRVSPNGKKHTVKAYKEVKTIPSQLKLFFYMALLGGFRRGELIALTWDKINFENNTVTIDRATGYANHKVYDKAPKTKGSERIVSLPNIVMELLKSYKKEQNQQKILIGDKWIDNNYVFVQWNGKQMHISTPTHAFKDILDKYNSTVDDDEKLPYIGLHGLRHTHATLLISSNTDIKTVSARLGHSNASTTLNIYTHSLKKQDEICADTLDKMFSQEN